MIVVDTNIIAYLWIPGNATGGVKELVEREPAWAAPFLWRSEFRNVLAGAIRRKTISVETALRAAEAAESHLRNHEYFVSSELVMRFVSESKCSAYDCEFVAVAHDLRVPLVTTDDQILREFPKVAVKLSEFVK